MFLRLFVELHVKAQQGLDGRLADFFLVPPFPVGHDHLPELGAVVPQVVDPDGVIPEEVVDFVNGIPDDGAADVADVEGLGDVRGGILHDDFLAVPQIAAAETVLLLFHFLRHGFHHVLLVQEEVDVTVEVFHLFKELLVDGGDDVVGDLHRGFFIGFRQPEAGEGIVPHFAFRGNLDEILDFRLLQGVDFFCQYLCYLFFKVDHTLLLFS